MEVSARVEADRGRSSFNAHVTRALHTGSLAAGLPDAENPML
jgi:hypothetical protein